MSVTYDFNVADSADIGAGWTPVSGSCRIVSKLGAVNAGVRGSSGGGYDWEVESANTWGADHSAQVTLRNGFADCGPVVRASNDGGGADGYMGMAHVTLGMRIYRRDNGGFTVLLDIGGSVAAGDTIRLDATGTTLTYYKNGVSQGSTTDATYAAGSPGLYCTDQSGDAATAPEVDDWVGTGEVAGGGGNRRRRVLLCAA